MVRTVMVAKWSAIASVLLLSSIMLHPLPVQEGGHGTELGQNPSAGQNVPYRVGGDVSAPVLIHSVDPEYTETARKNKVEGNVLLNIWVDSNGNPNHIHVIRGLGAGLDEKALEAVRQYRFKPAMKDGKPVRVELNLDLNFTLPKG